MRSSSGGREKSVSEAWFYQLSPSTQSQNWFSNGGWCKHKEKPYSLSLSLSPDLISFLCMLQVQFFCLKIDFLCFFCSSFLAVPFILAHRQTLDFFLPGGQFETQTWSMINDGRFASREHSLTHSLTHSLIRPVMRLMIRLSLSLSPFCTPCVWSVCLRFFN